MLTRSQRLTSTQITRLTAPYFFFKTPLFSVKAKKNDTGIFRFGFVISKKIDKRAVVRNKLKRSMAEVVKPLVPKDTGYDLLFIMRKEAIMFSGAQLNEKIVSLLTKEKII